MSRSSRPRLLFVVNADWFFVSHRLTLAIACRDAGFDVAVCAGETGARADIERRGIRFLPLSIERGGTNPLQELRTVFDLARVYRSERPDVVHHVTIKPVIYGSLAARALGVRGIVNAVSGLGYAFIPRASAAPAHRLLGRALWTAYRVALDGGRTRVIFQNEDDRKTFVGRRLVAAERTVLISGLGVDFEQFVATPLPRGELVVLLPARLLSDKGVHEFVAAAALLKPRFPSARFALLGRIDPGNPAGISRGQVESWVREGTVEWWGECTHEDMPQTLARAHVVVLPSYREGLPLVMAEAAACGRACITTDVPGCRDTVIDGETGWLVAPRDSGSLVRAIEAALSDPAELARRGRRGSEFSRSTFGIQAVVNRTMDIYRALLAAPLVAGLASVS